MNDTSKRLHPYEVAQRWALTYKTLERWRAAGIGPAYLKIGGKILYRLEDVEAYEASKVQKSTQKKADGEQA